MTARMTVWVASRGRPDSIRRLRKAITDTAAHDVDMVIRVDEDDPLRADYPTMARVAYVVGPRVRLAESWNESMEHVLTQKGYDYWAFWGDDVVPRTIGWDTELTNIVDERNGFAIAYGRDGVWDHTYGRRFPRQLILPTHTVIGTSMLKAMGWVALPGLVHYHIDHAWRELGMRTRTLVHVPGALIEHLHPLNTANPSQRDLTYSEAEAFIDADRAAFKAWRHSRQYLTDCRRVQEAILAAGR